MSYSNDNRVGEIMKKTLKECKSGSRIRIGGSLGSIKHFVI
jgi:hypothetical protein